MSIGPIGAVALPTRPEAKRKAVEERISGVATRSMKKRATEKERWINLRAKNRAEHIPLHDFIELATCIRDCGPDYAQAKLEHGLLLTLTDLDLADQMLTTLPKAITFLKELRTLDVSTNELKELPDELTRLENLLTLDIRYNEFASKPRVLGKLKKTHPKLLILDK